MIDQKTIKVIRLALSYLALALIAVFSVYPALWVVMASFRPGRALYGETLIPRDFTFVHYGELFSQTLFGQWYANTLVIAVITVVFGAALTMITGYIFSMFRFRGRKNLMNGLLVLGLFPGFMSMIAIYILLNQFNLLNTSFAIIIVYIAGSPLYFLYSKSYFDTIPKSLVEAARIDGSGHTAIFFRIILPLSTPLIVFTSMMTFAGAFTDFIFARLVLSSPEKQTLAVGLYDMINSSFSTQFTVFAAGCVLVAAPIAILFILMQRYLVESLTAGADKG
jgi:arabinogalactan oligomer / maltooligosaccharide transport system permease protein